MVHRIDLGTLCYALSPKALRLPPARPPLVSFAVLLQRPAHSPRRTGCKCKVVLDIVSRLTDRKVKVTVPSYSVC